LSLFVAKLIILLFVNMGRRFLAGPLSDTVKSVEVLNILRFDVDDISVIRRVEVKDPSFPEDDLFDDKEADTQILEKNRDGTLTYFARRKLPRPPE